MINSQFYLSILLCAHKHTGAVQERRVYQNPRSAPDHMRGSVDHMHNKFSHSMMTFWLYAETFFLEQIYTMSVCIPSILLSILFLAWQLHQKSVGLARGWGSSVPITPIIKSRSPEEGQREDRLPGTIRPPNKQAHIWSLVVLESDSRVEPSAFSFSCRTPVSILFPYPNKTPPTGLTLSNTAESALV